MMTIDEITKEILSCFKDVSVTEANGDLFFMYDKDKMMPFATIVTSDNDYDHASQLSRAGFFRLNIGVDKATFIHTFEGMKLKKGLGSYQESDIDFTKENVIMPHPVYGAMYWMCMVNPGRNSFPILKPYLEVAYHIAAKRQKLK
ncbi:DUF6194 family protein [Pedobacter heparinus]|uniref:DUF6194 family protein n=1 Tax=Pedobacter heparinus TaxID=984 RepID=UPI00292E294A|nr:DUF6194 family protein [Pedobacter heparinus]